MAIRTFDELLNAVNAHFADDTSDETIALIEDISDTIGQYKDAEDWHQKYDDNDKAWRKKYRDRFFESDHDKPESHTDREETIPTKFEELFTHERKKENE